MPDELNNLENDIDEEKKSQKKIPDSLKWALIALAFVVSSLGAFSLTKYFLLPKYQKYQIEKQIAEFETRKSGKPRIGMVHIIEELAVNPSGSGGRRFVVAEYAIESGNKKIIDEVISREPQLRDKLIRFLRHHTTSQIMAPTFQEKSRKDIMEIINSSLSSGKIDSLYYTKLILQ